MIYKDISITVNGTDLSASLRGLTFTQGVEQQEATAHGDNWRFFEAGLQTGSITAQFWQDYADSSVDDTISGLLSDADGFVVVIKPTSGAVGAGNPSFTATMNIENYERFSGEVGDKAICSVDFALAASTGFVRAES